MDALTNLKEGMLQRLERAPLLQRRHRRAERRWRDRQPSSTSSSSSYANNVIDLSRDVGRRPEPVRATPNCWCWLSDFWIVASRPTWETVDDHLVGIGQGDGRALAELLQHYPYIVSLGLSMFKSLMVFCPISFGMTIASIRPSQRIAIPYESVKNRFNMSTAELGQAGVVPLGMAKQPQKGGFLISTDEGEGVVISRTAKRQQHRVPQEEWSDWKYLGDDPNNGMKDFVRQLLFGYQLDALYLFCRRLEYVHGPHAVRTLFIFSHCYGPHHNSRCNLMGYAVQTGSIEILRLLLRDLGLEGGGMGEGQPLLRTQPPQGNHWISELHFAPNKVVVDFLVENQKSIMMDITTGDPLPTEQYVNSRAAKWGSTPLMDAVGQPNGSSLNVGSVDVVVSRFQGAAEALLQHGADLTITDTKGRTALHYAAMTKKGGAVIKLLLDAGADINLRDRQGWPPIQHAFYSGGDTKVLIERGATGVEQARRGAMKMKICIVLAGLVPTAMMIWLMYYVYNAGNSGLGS